MDPILITNILLIIFGLLFLKQKRKNALALLSFSLILLLFTCIYVFYRYDIRAFTPSKWIMIYLYLTPTLFIISVISLILIKRKQGSFGITFFLQRLFDSEQKFRLNRYFIGVLLFVGITTTVTVVVYRYELSHITPKEHGDPNDWAFTLFHFIWQFIYIIPLTVVLKKMELPKVSKSFLYSALTYLVGYIPFEIIWNYFNNA
jgi:hypothetical protein